MTQGWVGWGTLQGKQSERPSIHPSPFSDPSARRLRLPLIYVAIQQGRQLATSPLQSLELSRRTAGQRRNGECEMRCGCVFTVEARLLEQGRTLAGSG